MHFIKLGKRYINLDAIAAVVPRKKGLGYTVKFIGDTQMDICEMDMVDIKKKLRYGRNNQSRNQRNQHYSQFRPTPKRNFRNV